MEEDSMNEKDIEDVAQELTDFVRIFEKELGWQSQRRCCGHYMAGLLLDGERKSMTRLASRVPETDSQSLQQFIDQSPWDYDAVQNRLAAHMAAALKGKARMLILDNTTLPKKGEHSVGVARQYCGALGKIANCQSIVSLQCVAGKVHFPVSAKLYLPEEWTKDKRRLAKVGVPANRRSFREKWRIALELIDAVPEQLTFDVLTFDAEYGNNRLLLQELDDRGIKFVGQISESLSFWDASVEITNESSSMGRPRKHPRVVGRKIPRNVKKIADNLLRQPKKWKRIKLSLKSSKTVQACALRVREANSKKRYSPGPERWLLIEKLPDKTLRFSVSNLPTHTALADLVNYSHARWAIEQGYQQLKEELGLDHFEGRSWQGLHHHITVCFMAYCFLVLTQQFKKKTLLTFPQIREQINHILAPLLCPRCRPKYQYLRLGG
jgi:SRSO17 transposase